jgi:hypothetical protein
MREYVSLNPSGAVVALSAGLASVAGSYGLAGFTPGYVVAPVEGALSRWMPGAIVTFAITVLGDLGQQLNLAFATLLVVLLFATISGLAVVIGRGLDSALVPVVGTGLGTSVVAVALTRQPVPALAAALAAGLVVGIADLVSLVWGGPGQTIEDGNRRRRVISALGTAAAMGGLGAAVGRQGGGEVADRNDDEEALTFAVGDQLATAGAQSFHLDGMDPLVSDGFYSVDINSVDPNIEPAGWSLSVTGEVAESFELTYKDIREMDHEHRFVTLRCVGENLNGRKMDNAVWTGVPVEPLIERASPDSGCGCVMLHAADDYFVRFPIEALREGMLAYGMNGQRLPRGHGAPVRTLVPGHWGEVNVKWLSEIEFLDEEADGYWEQRGWQGTGPVKTVAKLHGTELRDDGDRVVVGGHAYAGTRGISGVEVSTDGGESWASADLTDRLPGAWGPAADRGGGGDEVAADAWRLWRHEYAPEGTHEVVARAIERDGTRQPSEETGPVPSGPSGWVSERVDPGAL